MKSLKFNIRHISCLGRPARKMFLSFWVKVCRAVPTSIRRFLGRLAKDMEYGFAVKYTIDLFADSVISKDEMLERIDELERKFNKS